MTKPNELTDKIEQEKERVENLIADLTFQNINDQAILDGHEAIFRKAVFTNADAKTIANINVDRLEASNRIQHRNELIDVLSSQSDQENPVLQSLLVDAFAKYLEGIKGAESKAETLQNKLKSQQKALIDGLQDMEKLRDQLHLNRSGINQHIHRLSEESLVKLGLTGERLPYPGNASMDTVYQLMIEILVERKEIRNHHQIHDEHKGYDGA